jgi:hypothetical protein
MSKWRRSIQKKGREEGIRVLMFFACKAGGQLAFYSGQNKCGDFVC